MLKLNGWYFFVSTLLMDFFSWPQVVNSQCLNFTLLSQFTYKCGLGRCKILSEYCDDDGSGTMQCNYCNRNVCNSDPQDYPGCKIACDYQFNRKKSITTTLRSSTLTQTTIQPEPNKQKTTITTRTVNCTEIINNNPSDKYKELQILTIVFAVAFSLSFFVNVILFVIWYKRSSKYDVTRKREECINTTTREKDASNRNKNDKTKDMGSDNSGFRNESENQKILHKKVNELRTHHRNPSNTTIKTIESGYYTPEIERRSSTRAESGYYTPHYTPEMERRNSTRTESGYYTPYYTPELEGRSSTRTGTNDMTRRNETRGRNIISSPQGEVSHKNEDGILSPSGK